MSAPSHPETAAALASALVERFEMESMALHHIQRDWLVREIGAAIETARADAARLDKARGASQFGGGE